VGPEGKDQYLNNMELKATESKGKLRLIRNGSQLQYLVAEEQQAFKALQRVEIGTDDVQAVHGDCFTMSAPVALDVRLTELVIDANQFPNGIPSAPVPAAPVESPLGSKGSLQAVELLGALLAIVLLIGLEAWLYVRSNRRKEQQAPAEAVAPHLSFACSTCGKQLKAKVELAGKKAKCSQCGKPVLVPGTKASEAGDLSR
jgi:DNA-directed RNA polymerase subunit RPC12/RpoP